MAIGSLDRAGRLRQLRVFATVLLRAGYQTDDQVRADVLEAVGDEVRDPSEAARLTDEYLAAARAEWRADAETWPETTDFDRLQAAFDDLRAAGIAVLEAVDDHWAANALLHERAAVGRRPRGVAFFTPSDVWHAVEHHMLELNVWHGSGANITDSDPLLTDTLLFVSGRGLGAHFDEGRIEVNVRWQRRPVA